jgi:hypothetical protein
LGGHKYGLNIIQLSREDTYITVAIAALIYCKKHETKDNFIRAYRLQKEFDAVLRTAGKSAPGNREYEYCRDKCETEGLIRVEQISLNHTKPETRIYPDEQLIYAKIQEMINANPHYGDKRLVEIERNEPRNAWKNLEIESVKTSDRATYAKTRSRTINEESTKILDAATCIKNIKNQKRRLTL